MRNHDTHFHLDLMPDPKRIAEEIERQQIYTIAVTNSPSVFFYTEEIASTKKYIRAALGLHPELASSRYNEVSQFIELIDRTRYIGEIGLDNSNKSPHDYQKQKVVFEQLISACADSKDKILTLHSRRSIKDVLDVLGEDFPGKVILHWYSGSLKHLKLAVDRGYYFSVNFAMLQSANGKKIVSAIPVDRILIETDGPFTSLHRKPFTPIMSSLIMQKLYDSEPRVEPFDSFKSIINNNFKTLIV